MPDWLRHGPRTSRPDARRILDDSGLTRCRQRPIKRGVDDWTAKLSEVATDVLEAGEQVLAAVFVVPPATSCTATAIAARAAARDEIGATLPAAASVLGLTDRRLLVYGHSSFSDRPDGLQLSVPACELRRVDVEDRPAACRFVLRFDDGSKTVYDAPRPVNDARPFVAAVRR